MKKKNPLIPLLLWASLAALCVPQAFAKNLHVIDKDGKGFIVVRTGRPSLKDFRELCGLGVRKMIVMSGDGSIESEFAKTECPGFEVVYDKIQRTKTPLSGVFLDSFDRLVADARENHYGIAFRCKCGCHRTGRLAAYYKMKYHGISPKDAVVDQRDMAPGAATLLFRRVLKLQIRALKDHITGTPCTQKKAFCVTDKDASLLPGDAAAEKVETEELEAEDA